MTINRNNFEEYYLDYLEGNLDPLLIADLMAFLAENPEFEKFLPESDNHFLNSEETEFSHKHLIKKTFSDIREITDKNFEEFCIASAEGILNTPETHLLSEYISVNPGKEIILKQYESLKLKPDYSVTFAGKAILKKNKKISFNSRVIYYSLSLAASVAFIFALFSINLHVENDPYLIPVAEMADSIKPGNLVHNSIPTNREIKTTAVNKAVIKSEPVTVQKTNDSAFNVKIREQEVKLSKLDPVRIISIKTPEDKLPLFYDSYENAPVADNKLSEDREGILNAFIAKVDLWKTAEKAINGINMLTETDLSISKNTDKDGNLTGLLLNTERYIIEGNKVK